MVKLKQWLAAAIQGLSLRRRWRVIATVDAADQVPENLPRRGAVLVAPSAEPTWIAFDCPCGQDHRIMLNLDQSRRPTWVVRHKTPLTLYPSVDAYTQRGRCHFIIRRGKMHWARDDIHEGQSNARTPTGHGTLHQQQ